MNPTTLAFTAFMATPELAYDITILWRGGHVQARAEAEQDGCGAGWFSRAASAYPPGDSINALARRTCELLAAHLRTEVPS